MAPSPRNASVASGAGSRPIAIAVGWNCTNSVSASMAPARAADARPSPRASRRIGGHRIEMTDAAGRQHDRARRQCGEAFHPASSGRECRGRVPSVDDQFLGDEAFEDADARRVPHGRNERRHDGAARRVALHADDAARRMRGLARDHELALEIAVERNAVGQKIGNALRRLARHGERESPRRRCRRPQRSCRAHVLPACRLRPTAAAMPPCAHALDAPCPSGAAVITRDRPRRELQRAEQAGEAAADDDDVVWAASGAAT